MQRPEFPADEENRLKTLRGLNVLDTEAEERFDRLTRLAKRLFGVPIALVSLVDHDRQWFKSTMGLEATETPRDISFCGHAILGSEVFVVPNAVVDDRFADNPLVVGDPNIRFYAGCPLHAANGAKVGTLCIIDREAREFTAEDIEALRDLAVMTEKELAAIQLATLDELTGISNRRGFMQLAQQGLSLCARQNAPASLVFFDLDKFKPINDKFGHAEGDAALIVVAENMRRAFRDSDVFARLGGDEFVVLLTNTVETAAEIAVQRFAQLIQAHNRQANRGYDIAFSHGVVSFDPARHKTIEAMIADGDTLMYDVKKLKTTDRLMAAG